jgi:hypothetical protein
MRLPGADRALVAPEKVRDYLLSVAHPIGRFKARFFTALGYSRMSWKRLETDLRHIAARHRATLTDANRYGQKYEVRGRLEGPNGRVAELVTVWIVLRDEEMPRFVTAFPGPRR